MVRVITVSLLDTHHKSLLDVSLGKALNGYCIIFMCHDEILIVLEKCESS